MFRRAACASAGIALCVTLAGALTVLAQNPPQQPPPLPNPPAVQPPPGSQGQPPVNQQLPPVQLPPVVTGGQQQIPAQQPQRSAQAYRAKSVLGSRVSIQGNVTIGTVDDIIFDDNGYIDYLIVLNEGKFVTVPWEAMRFNFEQRTATVEITQQQYQQIPTFTPQQWPTTFYDPAYRVRVYQYYGLTPPPDRRPERRPARGGRGGGE